MEEDEYTAFMNKSGVTIEDLEAIMDTLNTTSEELQALMDEIGFTQEDINAYIDRLEAHLENVGVNTEDAEEIQNFERNFLEFFYVSEENVKQFILAMKAFIDEWKSGKTPLEAYRAVGLAYLDYLRAQLENLSLV